MVQPNSLQQKFVELKRQVADLATQKIRLEGEVARLNDEKQAILKQAASLGVDPKQLDQIIAELEADVQGQLVELEHKLHECTTRLAD